MRLTISEILKATNGTLLNGADSCVIEEITTDSRKMMHHGLFVPLQGERFDGHDFIGQVYDKGAVATLSMSNVAQDTRLITIQVADTKKALLDLAHAYRQKFDLPLVGITGSVGKTSTKEMIHAVLSGKWHVHKTEGNFNNEIGLPLTLFKLDTMHEAAVIEMGMNHFGEIHTLSQTALPDVAVITNVGTSHIENLGSREGILKAKLEILDGLKPEGLLVINGDNDLLGAQEAFPVRHVTYGLDPKNDYYAEDLVTEGETTCAKVTSPLKKYTIRIQALGEHMVYNTLAAIAVAEYLGLSEAEIMKGLQTYTPAKMRMHIETLPTDITIIDDTYNASPDSMEAALKVLRDYTVKGRRIAVLGDMFEMGNFAPSLHERVGQFAGSIGLDICITIGELAEHIHQGYIKSGGTKAYHYTSQEAFLEAWQQAFEKGDCVLFKASRGMHFENLVEAIKK